MINKDYNIRSICHVSTTHSRFDTRIFHKECVSLSRNGYSITLLICDDEVDEFKEGVAIKSIKGNKSNRFIRMFILPIKMMTALIKIKPKIVHFHDPELILFGIIVSLFGVKVIYDVHEDLSSTINYKKWIKGKLLKKLLFFIVKVLENVSAYFFSAIVCVNESIAEKFAKSSKTVIISNYPILHKIKNMPQKEEVNKNTVIYVGQLSEVRGIKTLINAMSYLSPDCRLVLVGEWESLQFQQSCQNTEGWERVIYKGYLPLDDAYNEILNTTICVITVFPIKNYTTGIMVKILEYMALGKPVIMSNFPYWKNLFNDCAYFVDPQNPEDIARGIGELLNNFPLRKVISENGKSRVFERYSWESEEKKLIDLYGALI